MFGTPPDGALRVAFGLPTVGPERDDNGDDRVQRRCGGGEPVPPAPRRSLRPQPRGTGRRAPRRRCPGRDRRGGLPGDGRDAGRGSGPGHRRPRPPADPRSRRGRLGPGPSPAGREPDPAADPDRGRMPTPDAGRSAPPRGAPAREAHQPARAADHRPRPAPGDRTSMKRATIGFGVLVTFFLLAMFLMADAEVPTVDDTAVVTSTSAR